MAAPGEAFPHPGPLYWRQEVECGPTSREIQEARYDIQPDSSFTDPGAGGGDQEAI